jgi:hypothetical protein
MSQTLIEHITKADERFQEECQMFERMIGKPEFDRIKEAVLSTIRQGNFEAHSDGMYRMNVQLDSVDGSNIKNHLEERRYFRNKYHHTYGIPLDVLMAEINNTIQSEFPEIRVKFIQTQNLRHIYHTHQQHSRFHIAAVGCLMVLTTIALCGLPLINECINPMSDKVSIVVFFTQIKNV